ncbi:D-lactate dehydrogenase (cytochrome) [Peptoclostridium litorale DSM 5388]|uniref:D-lactate dehydrogenase (cytochrome) n=1 Tax=Peptoclostridium litorale DSM 5388 TaxID=1121324 RepID=A0A069RHV3_PEPLI|nr:FAD-binding oxidoreductase [Peptoclostridium litorale]KDR95725.1 glycolate oxidase subunit GlcD [Peptoclostridium litorale DSM 5388]SIO22545.1 D-lactate dehydrogenase (cytochrome) [Peptoclostridium litorale DSM 5388]
MELIRDFGVEYEDFLRDESRITGRADSISFPKNEKQVQEIMYAMHNQGIPVTVQGARTGIAGGAVPDGGHIMNLTRMNNITGMRYDSENGRFYISVQPGMLLSELRETLSKKSFDTSLWDETSKDALETLRESGEKFFTPDPTEATASIGGLIACNASGARSFKYGSTRNHIQRISAVLANGEVVSLERGKDVIAGGELKLKTESGKTVKADIMRYGMPNVKNASGYYFKDKMDVLDLFIGCEGSLGIVTQAELVLLDHPDKIYALTAFFTDEKRALEYVEELKESAHVPASIEYFNEQALDLIGIQKEKGGSFSQIPDFPKEAVCAVYTEYHGKCEKECMEAAFEYGNTMEKCGANEKNTWLAMNNISMEGLHAFRHAVPEIVNMMIDERRKEYPQLTKLGTDMAVPKGRLFDVMDMYNSDLKREGLESAIFGHIGDNHLHVNIIPRDPDDYAKGKKLYESWAERVCEVGGTVSAEHGIGKLKIALLEKMYGKEGIESMKNIKSALDPKGILCRGNLFT